MPIYIYNSLSKKKEEFIPLNPPQVKMYVCGPTVYDEPHIGHARSAYIFDVIRRYLVYRGYKVTFVRNVTDVDDKIIEKAKEEFKGEDLKLAVEKVSRKYLDSYHEAMELLGIDTPDKEPKATEYIPKMIKFIEALVKNGSAYASGGDVYFDIKKAKDYGKLSNQNLEKMESGVRVAPGENKKDPLDFALWKAAKEGEPSWKSPWGQGRPGWHVECSVMSSDILGDEFDIHGGGLDLIFPHHENEIAQSEGAGKKFARYWMHHGLLTINAQKMSKSLGNFVTVDDILNKHKYPVDALKICYLTVDYSNPLDFSWERMDVAQKELYDIVECINKVDITIRDIKEYADLISQAPAPSFKNEIDVLKGKFEKAMEDNFNTPQAKSVIFQLIHKIYINMPNLLVSNKGAEDLGYVRGMIIELCGILGLSLKIEKQLTEEEKTLIDDRNEARKNKDFGLADKIRKELEKKGVILEDAKDGKTTWRREF